MRSGEALTVTWQAEQSVPASTEEPDDLFWSADLWSDENTGYAVRVALDGSTWTAEVASFVDEITFTPLINDPVRNGNELTVRVPLDHLPELARTFRSYATTEWGGATFYNDSCPGGGSRLAFERRSSLTGVWLPSTGCRAAAAVRQALRLHASPGCITP